MIRCIANRTKGFGNLRRCLMVADILRRTHTVFFIIDNDKTAINEIKKKKFQYITISKKYNTLSESKFIVDVMKTTNSKLVIVDMREFGENITYSLSSYPIKIIMLDDAWGKNAYADMIINGTLTKLYHNYKKKNKKCKLYLGTKYFIVNKDFIENQKKNFNIVDSKYYHVVISMGGSDPDDITLLVTKSILNIDRIKLKIILGPMYAHKSRLYRLIKNRRHIKLVISPTRIWKEFSKSDLVISNAGNTLFELAIMKIPTICISSIDHQIPYAKEFARRGFAVNLGLWNKIKEKTISDSVELLLSDRKLRKKISTKGPSIVDGKGLARVQKIICQLESNIS